MQFLWNIFSALSEGNREDLLNTSRTGFDATKYSSEQIFINKIYEIFRMRRAFDFNPDRFSRPARRDNAAGAERGVVFARGATRNKCCG